MNLLQLVMKQMRQRALGTSLTLLSVLLGVALVIAIMILQRESKALFGQSDYGYDVLIGAQGSPLQLVLNTVYHLDRSPGNIPYSLYEQLISDPQYRSYIKMAIPYGVGDSYEGYRIVASIPKLFGYDDAGRRLSDDQIFEYRPGRRFDLAEGVVFHPAKFEAIIGSEISQRTGLKLGSQFKATHGLPQPNVVPDIHEQLWTVVGILKPTHTAEDRVLFIPLSTFYAISEHEESLEAMAKIRQGADIGEAVAAPRGATRPAPTTTTAPAPAADPLHDHELQYTQNPDGTIELKLPKSEWVLSAILVRSKGFPASGAMGMQLMYLLKTRGGVTAVTPAIVMQEFFAAFLAPSSKVLLLVALLVTVVASVGILVSIYNSVSARLKEIAILRALGATRQRVLSLICVEAGVIGLLGALLGFAVGHALGAVGSMYMSRLLGEGIDWTRTDWTEAVYLLLVMALAVLAGLVPAMKAYRTPVATNLVAA